MIRRSESLYRTTLDASLDAIIGLDPSFHISTWNRGAHNMFGYTSEEALGKDISILFHPSVADTLKEQATTIGVIRNCDVDGLSKSGLSLNLNLTWAGTSISNEQIREWTLVIRDITDQKRILGQLIQAEKLSVVGQLISGIAHEINGPLNAVVGYAELLLTGDKKISGHLKEDIQFIHENSVRCRDIVSNLLRFVRKADLQKKDVDINNTVQSALKLLHFRVVKKESIQLTCDLAPDLPTVAGDSQQLGQILVNLIHNACDALTDIRGPKHIIVKTTHKDSIVTLQVSDNGVGMPAHVKAKIFEPFFTTKAEGKGTGLGLAITNRLVQDHGGTIKVESQLNYGTTFLISLPAGKAPQSLMSPKIESHIYN